MQNLFIIKVHEIILRKKSFVYNFRNKAKYLFVFV